MQGSVNYLAEPDGWLGTDPYSTAWVALVPDPKDPDKPAWPDALVYLRTTQLADGGWGDRRIYYAYERTIATLAAVLALHTWKLPGDDHHIQRALAALRQYARDLPGESHEPIGFELLSLHLIDELLPLFPQDLPLEEWAPIRLANQEKLALIPHLRPNPAKPGAWWLSMEMLPEKQLAEQLDDSFLDPYGSIATSTAATAAYLRARRHTGHDSAPASHYLRSLLQRGDGSVPFCWPAEVFDRLWSLDAFRRAGYDPRTPFLESLITHTHASWNLNGPGISYSDVFPITDGDLTLVGFTVLQWAGLTPPDEPLLAFWDHDHFRTYLDERNASVSANIHGLTALRSQPGFPHRDLASRLTKWLVTHLKPDVMFDDKWQFSPFYCVSHAIPAFAGWDNPVAMKCVNFLLDQQRPDGGWGHFGYSTMEETAHCTIGLYNALEAGLLTRLEPLARAALFFWANADRQAVERLWIGKTLYRPEGVVNTMLFAAQSALERLGLSALALEEARKIA